MPATENTKQTYVIDAKRETRAKSRRDSFRIWNESVARVSVTIDIRLKIALFWGLIQLEDQCA